ncbi:hypothetical protein BYT27DRAFT_6751460 [Phlegmacium glaucopus]|nr:hypothetical protein BYT27DRAFT_6751460 [Phlegmacium glaucopus]
MVLSSAHDCPLTCRWLLALSVQPRRLSLCSSTPCLSTPTRTSKLCTNPCTKNPSTYRILLYLLSGDHPKISFILR